MIKKTSIDKQISSCVDFYQSRMNLFTQLSKSLVNYFSDDELLKPHIHSIKYRIKEPLHLKRKLEIIADKKIKNKEEFDITTDNLFSKIEDLAGVRILHLNTNQIIAIDKELKRIFKEQMLVLIGKPTANTWDVEREKFFRSLEMKISNRETLYTSVHYIVRATNKIRAEIQVRTLMEEVWGEVSHSINYPIETKSISCKEQLKVLARVTSSGTRLVDSIFKSLDEFKKFNS